jgi:GNAT superfamily N-acetyltransferase
MKKTEIIALFNHDQRKNAVFPDLRREETAEVVRYIDTADIGGGFILYSQLNEANVDAVIQEQIDYFEGIRQSFEWKVFDFDTPEDLKDRLVGFGFAVEDEEALMVLDLTNAPDFLWQPIQHQVQRLVNAEQLVDVQKIEEQVWEEDASWVHNYLGGTLRNHPEAISIFVAYMNDKPASAAWTFFSKESPFASLWGGATVSEFRKQGLYTALLAIRAQEARERGIKFLTVDASPMSRPILEKFGFICIGYTTPFRW